MHHFQHGILLAFLRPVGACFGLPLKQEEEDESTAADDDLHKNEDGCLLPLSGEEEGFLPPALSGEDEDFADNLDLHEEGELLPESGEEHEGFLPPQRGEKQGMLSPMRGDEVDTAAANIDLQPEIKGHKDKEDNGVSPPMREDDAEIDDLQPIIQGQDDEGGYLPPLASEDDEMDAENPNLQPQSGEPLQEKHKKDDDGMLRLTIGATYDGDFLPYLVDSLHVEVMHAWKQVLLTFMHATIGGHGKACMVHDDVVIVHAKPRVDPKVKKKTSLLLCLSIDMPFHPGEHGHDGIPHLAIPHHEPCSCPLVHHSPHLPSTATLSLPTSFLNEAKDAAKEVFQANNSSIHLPFTPLRGRKSYQAREMQDELKMMACTGSKTTKIRMTKMRLSYLMKDVLDPG